jgi:hypothetical protein
VTGPHLPSDKAPDGVSCAKQADAGLERLLTAVLSARSAMQTELRLRPPDFKRQNVRRQVLLKALESYTSALSSRGLSAPPRLRDELAMQRNLAAHS